MNEEIQTKVGMDLTGVDSGCKTWKQKVEEASLSTQGSFIRAGSAGKAFKNVLNEATAQFPILGQAARLAISPTVGLLGLASAAFVFLKQSIDDAEESYKKFSDDSAKPIGDVKKVLADAKKASEEHARAFDKWLQSHNHAADEITNKLNKQLVLLDAQFKVYENILKLQGAKGGGPGSGSDLDSARLKAENQMRERAQKDLIAKRDVAGFDVAKAREQQKAIDAQGGRGADAVSSYENNIKESNEKIKKLLDEKDKLDRGDIGGISIDFKTGSIGSTRSAIETDLSNERKLRDANERALAKARQRIKSDDYFKRGVADNLTEAQGRFDTYSHQADENAAAIAKNKLGIVPDLPKSAPAAMTYQQRIAAEQSAYQQQLAAGQEAWRMRNPDYARQVREGQMQETKPQGVQVLEQQLSDLNRDLTAILADKGIIVKKIVNGR
jgi:hypothetical protein